MPPNHNSVKSKIALLELAKRYGDIKHACDEMGYSRDSYYRFKRLYEKFGEAGLRETDRRKPILKNRLDPAIELAILNMALDQPELGQQQVSRELKENGIIISPGGVRLVWLRHNLETYQKRFHALEEIAKTGKVRLSQNQLQALQKPIELKQAEGDIESKYPGYIGVQDTYFVGEFTELGSIYQQTFLDVYTNMAFVHLSDDNYAYNSHDLMLKVMEFFFEDEGICLERVLTDRGKEFCDQKGYPNYDGVLSIHDIEHITTKAPSPQANGFADRFHSIINTELYEKSIRKKTYQSVVGLQRAVNFWIKYYNYERPNSGRYCKGRTPFQTYKDRKDQSRRFYPKSSPLYWKEFGVE